MMQDELFLPMLRDDIQLNEAPPEPDGAPAWTLYDPAANKYYKIGWLEFECLSRFRNHRTGRDLIRALEKETTLNVDEDTIKTLILFLIQSKLVHLSGAQSSEHLIQEKEKHHKSWWQKLLHGYLFFTIPLFKPQRFLEKSYPYIKFLLSRSFMLFSMLLFGYGVFLTIQRWDEFSSTFMSYFNLEGIFLLLAATVFVKIFHELGHAYTATKYGVPVSVIGVAFMVMYPVLYTETTNAWKLQNRRDRFYIAAAGIMSEFALAAMALVLWHFLLPGILQSLCFMVAVVSLVASLAVNLNPLMRFDGYYLFSEMVGVDNLQDRSFAFMKWRLRKILWGWDDNPPEVLPRDRQRLLITFGTCVTIYRFFLYTGIAVLVYHLFFQPLGLILMAVELGFFIFLPVVREVDVWRGRFSEIVASRRGRWVGAIVGLAFLLLFVPLQGSIAIPAVMHAHEYTRLYPSAPGRVEEILVKEGQSVKTNDTLFRLSSPDLQFNIEIASRRLSDLESIREKGQANLDLAKKRVTLESEIDSARKQLEGYIKQREMLVIRAPYNGIVRDMDPWLHVGQWVGRDHKLGLLVDTQRPVLSGYVREKDMPRVTVGRQGIFYAEFSPMVRYDVILEKIEPTGTSDIYWPELASVNKGEIPATRDSYGNVKSLPQHTLYAVRFQMVNNGHNQELPEFVSRGDIRLEVVRTNTFNLLIRHVISVLIRESGF